MTFTMKKYQENAVNNMVMQTKQLFNNFVSPKTFVLHAPTGSGKTFMMSKYTEKVISELPDIDFVFIWISVGEGGLHIQSYESVISYLNGFPKCTLYSDTYKGSKSEISRNEITFIDWQLLSNKNSKTKQWKNIAMKSGEKYNFPEIIRNCRIRGARIVLIIDESHARATGKRASEIRNDIIKPDLTVEVSATPVLEDKDYVELVRYEDVIAEKMMRKEVILNSGINENNIPNDDTNSQELIMECAFAKREELSILYSNEHSKVNPLCLIQVPDSNAGADKIAFVIDFLSEKGINTNNGRLKIWLSETSRDLDKNALRKIDDETEYLIFKEAISQGWDCPRAQILVRFREIKSFTFETQVVGRILRTPEQEFYLDERLNAAYAFTNLKTVIVAKKEATDNIIKTLCSKRNDLVYNNFTLRSYYKQRESYNDINNTSIDFKSVLEKYFVKYLGLDQKNKFMAYINLEDAKKRGFDFIETTIKDSMISESNVEYSDIDKKIVIEQDNINIDYSLEDLQNYFDQIIKRNLNGLAFVRSSSRIRTALTKCFSDYFDINLKKNGIVYIQSLVIKYENAFDKILNEAIKEFKTLDLTIQKRKGIVIDEHWEICKEKYYNSATHIELPLELSLYQPFYVLQKGEDINNLEKDFAKYLNKKSAKILWFWQNGMEHNTTNFGIEDGNDTFRPDWIVQFRDGRIGIFDTKPINYNYADTKHKAEALSEYLIEEQNIGKNVIGGIIVQERNNSFRINRKKLYKSIDESPDDWEYFSEILGE